MLTVAPTRESIEALDAITLKTIKHQKTDTVVATDLTDYIEEKIRCLEKMEERHRCNYRKARDPDAMLCRQRRAEAACPVHYDVLFCDSDFENEDNSTGATESFSAAELENSIVLPLTDLALKAACTWKCNEGCRASGAICGGYHGQTNDCCAEERCVRLIDGFEMRCMVSLGRAPRKIASWH
jgi:hypothetical protein